MDKNMLRAVLKSYTKVLEELNEIKENIRTISKNIKKDTRKTMAQNIGTIDDNSNNNVTLPKEKIFAFDSKYDIDISQSEKITEKIKDNNQQMTNNQNKNTVIPIKNGNPNNMKKYMQNTTVNDKKMQRREVTTKNKLNINGPKTCISTNITQNQILQMQKNNLKDYYQYDERYSDCLYNFSSEYYENRSIKLSPVKINTKYVQTMNLDTSIQNINNINLKKIGTDNKQIKYDENEYITKRKNSSIQKVGVTNYKEQERNENILKSNKDLVKHTKNMNLEDDEYKIYLPINTEVVNNSYLMNEIGLNDTLNKNITTDKTLSKVYHVHDSKLNKIITTDRDDEDIKPTKKTQNITKKVSDTNYGTTLVNNYTQKNNKKCDSTIVINTKNNNNNTEQITEKTIESVQIIQQCDNTRELQEHSTTKDIIKKIPNTFLQEIEDEENHMAKK